MTTEAQQDITHTCGYCRKVKPQQEMEQYKARHFYTQRHLDKLDWYCTNVSEMSCATKMQCSLEG